MKLSKLLMRGESVFVATDQSEAWRAGEAFTVLAGYTPVKDPSAGVVVLKSVSNVLPADTRAPTSAEALAALALAVFGAGVELPTEPAA